MALRLCASVLREPAHLVVGVRVSFLLGAARHTRVAGGADGPAAGGWRSLHFPPAHSMVSQTILESLLKNKATDTRGWRAAVPHDSDEHKTLLVNDPDQPENSKILKVAVIGAPNAGKSTLSNQLLGRKVFAVSKKVHTTRSHAQGIFTEHGTQIVIVDTPGLINASKVKRHHLETSLLVDPWKSVQKADLVLVVVDVSDKWTRNKLGFEVLKCLAQNQHIPAVLVLNKVDLLKNKSMLIDITVGLTEGIVNGKKLKFKSVFKPLPKSESRDTEFGTTCQAPSMEEEVDREQDGAVSVSFTASLNERLSKEDLGKLRDRQGWPCFQDVFMLSAVDSEDVEALKRYLVVEAKPGSWHYHSGVLTDQSPEEICINAVRERLLEYLPQEVPYNVSQTIEMWHESDNGDLDILVKLNVKKENHFKMLIGQGGHMISRIAQEAGQDLINAFHCNVKLKLSVKMKK